MQSLEAPACALFVNRSIFASEGPCVSISFTIYAGSSTYPWREPERGIVLMHSRPFYFDLESNSADGLSSVAPIFGELHRYSSPLGPHQFRYHCVGTCAGRLLHSPRKIR